MINSRATKAFIAGKTAMNMKVLGRTESAMAQVFFALRMAALNTLYLRKARMLERAYHGAQIAKQQTN